jgi:hypothetical protein
MKSPLRARPVRLVKEAWRSGYKGLAVLLAAAWDSQLSLVDARKLRAGDMRRDPIGIWFEVAHAKTGREAIATLSPAHGTPVARLSRQPARRAHGRSADFRQPVARPYSKDTLGDDFRDMVQGVR